MSQITASELVVKVSIQDREATAGLNRLADLVDKVGRKNIGPGASQSLEKLNTSARLASGGMTDLQRAQATLRIEKLQSDISVTSGRLEQMTAKLNAAKNATDADADKVRALELSVQAMTARLRNSEGALDIQKRKLNDVGKELGEAGKGYGVFGQMAIGGLRRVGESIASNFLPAIGSVINIGMEYESSMSMFGAVTGASAEQMQRAGELSKALGADLDLPATSAAGAATAMTELSKAGLSAEDSMNAAKGTLQLAAAGMISEKEAAEQTAGALNAFALQGNEATRIADLLAASVSASGSSVTETGTAMRQAGTVFASAGVPIEDMIVLINELSKSGLKGSDAGTSLKTMLMRLTAPTNVAKSELERLNIAVFDSQGKMNSMRDIIGQLTAATKNMSDADRSAAFTTIFGADAIRAANIVVKEGTEGFDAFAEKTQKSGAAGKLAGAQMTGLGGAVKGLQSQLETAALNGIEPLLPLMTAVVSKLSEFAGWIADNIGPVMADFVRGTMLVYDALSTTFGWISANATPVLTVLVAGLGLYTTATISAAVATSGGLIPALTAAAASFGITTVGIGAATTAMLAFVAQAAIVLGSLYLVYEAANAFTELSDKVHDGSLAVLETIPWWNESRKAVSDYTANAKAHSPTAKLIADSLHGQNEALYLLTQQYALGMVSEERYKEEGQKLRDAIKNQTSSLNDLVAAEDKQNDQIVQSQMAAVALRDEHANLTESTQTVGRAFEALPEDIEAAQKAMEKAQEGGVKAFGELVSSTVGYHGEVVKLTDEHTKTIANLTKERDNEVNAEKKAALQERIDDENASYNDTLQSQSVAYAQQQSAQRQHLGMMMIDWINAQAMINPAFAAKNAELVGMVEERYGVMASMEQKGLGDSLELYTQYANGVIGSSAELNQQLDKTERKYVDQALAAEKLRGEYVAKIITDFESGKYGDGPEAIAVMESKLAGVDKEVVAKVRLDSAQAEAAAEKTQEKINRIPNHYQSKAFLDANAVDTGAGKATAAINKIPQSKKVTITDNTVHAAEQVQRYTNKVNTVPKTTTTTANFVSGGAITAASTIGNQLSQGLAAGISARADAVAAALKASIVAAVIVARAAAMIASPSKLTNTELGAPLIEGVAAGINAKSGGVAKAFTEGIGKGVSEAVVKAADGVSKIADTISKSVDAMSDIRGFEAPGTAQIKAYGASLQATIIEFTNSTNAIKGRLTDTTAKYAEIIGTVVDTIGKGVDSLSKLNEFEAPSREAIISFMDALQMAVYFFHQRGVEISATLSSTSILFADVSNKVLDTIGKGVEALNKLNNFEAPTRESLESFSFAVRDVVVDFWHRAQEIGFTLDGTVEEFASTASTAIDTVAKGVESLMKLNDYSGPSRDAMTRFSYDLRDIVVDFWHRFQEIGYVFDGSVQEFAETANAAIEVIGSGVESLMKLSTFVAPSRETMLSFSISLRDMVADFWHRSQEVNYALTESTTAFAETASTAVGTIADGVEAFAALDTFIAPSRDSIALFSLALRDTVQEFANRTAELDASLFAVTNQFAETAGKVVDTIGGGIEAFSALQSYSGVPQQNLEAFGNDLMLAIQLMITIASRLDVEGVAAAATFAENAGKVVAPIKAGVEAFASLKDYERVASERMQALFADLQLATSMMIVIAQNADQDGVAAAASFSQSVKQVFDGLKSGIDAFDALRKYESVPADRISALMGDFGGAVDMMNTLAGAASGSIGASETWKNALETFANNIRAGVDAIGSIDGLSVHATIGVGVDAGVTEGGGGAQVDGSHALGLSRVPFDGYRALLHEGEAVLTASEAADWRKTLYNRSQASNMTATSNGVLDANTDGGGVVIQGPLIGNIVMKDEGWTKDEVVAIIYEELRKRR